MVLLSAAGVHTPSFHHAYQRHQAQDCDQEGRFSGKHTDIFAILLARVLILGAAGVGKTSLCSQFLSSANTSSYEPDCESVEKEVAVSINNQETRLVFIDHTHGEISASDNSIEMKGIEIRANSLTDSLLCWCKFSPDILFNFNQLSEMVMAFGQTAWDGRYLEQQIATQWTLFQMI